MGHSGSRHKPEARILLLGLDGAGKSTLLYKLKYNEDFYTVPTIGFNVEMIEAKKNKDKITLTVWDVGGQVKMRAHWKNFYQDTAGIVFVVDSSDIKRLDEAKSVLEQTLKSDHLRGLPVVVLANKQDIVEAATVTEITEQFNLRNSCSDRDWFVQPCSATTGMGLVDGFRRVAHLVKMTPEDNNFKETVKYIRSKSVIQVKK
ncbi:ADP-ribosylation factor 14 [Labeo rohita]|uniref:ADP-ribosylation factor-like protein 14 n=1 Tax=Labeo rohita TaxID=84645 RepID=A0A498M8N4_LABRO|nr:ADP-ribosylation factor-like protein 14 [Labeo rohita]RXN06748.1 ADP-ribosylation factor 14 [Labeo rohita]RXN13965.1 ADP-ribosylation factor 14 [Labeo rohita]